MPIRTIISLVVLFTMLGDDATGRRMPPSRIASRLRSWRNRRWCRSSPARTFGATGNANLNAFGQNIKITGQIKASLSDPMKLKVEIPKMQNFKQSGPRMTINVDLPFDISGSAAGGPITVTLGKTPVNLHLEVEADVKLTSPNGKTKAEVTIRHWDGGLNNLNLGNDPASQALKQAIKQLLEQNRDVANKALKLPPRKGEPNSTFR